MVAAGGRCNSERSTWMLGSDNGGGRCCDEYDIFGAKYKTFSLEYVDNRGRDSVSNYLIV
jgi:hypothetical protein